jgi:cytochrome b6-f complex iron-sulfur subunit
MSELPETPDPRETGGEPEGRESVTRRAALAAGGTVIGLGYCAALGYPIYRYLSAAADKSRAEAAVTEVEVAEADLPALGQAKMIKFGGRPTLLIHHSDDTWTALGAICTHLGCTVAYDAAAANIHCACHGGVYDARTGANISGPPPRPLTLFKTTLAEGKVVVSRA